jgi:cell pole-organizing protein PopZ
MAEEEAKIEAEAAAPEEDDSMEDILHSIRDIISDEDEDATPKDVTSDATTPKDEPAPEEDILDLTDIAEDTPSEDVLSDIDAALEPASEEAQAVEEAPEAPAVEPAPIAEAPKPAPKPEIPAETLIADTTAAASSSVMKELVDIIPRPAIERKDFRSGNTVEDLVLEGLKPMLKEWLDGNLEALTREIVEREIKKLLPRD